MAGAYVLCACYHNVEVGQKGNRMRRLFFGSSLTRTIEWQNPLNVFVVILSNWPKGEGEPYGAARVAAANILWRNFSTCWMMIGSRSWQIFA